MCWLFKCAALNGIAAINDCQRIMS
jgi:hypothetical protein